MTNHVHLALVRYVHLNPVRARMAGQCAGPHDLDAIIAAVAAEHGLALDDLRSKRRHPDLVQARGVVAQRALLEGVANMSQVGRYLNRAPSTISALLHGRR